MRHAIIDAFSAFRFVLGRPVHLYRFGLWPLVATIVMAMMLGSLSGVFMGFLASLPGNSDAASFTILLFLNGLPSSWFASVFAVRWHRLVLTGEDRISGFDGAFSQRVGRFFAWVCLLDILLIAAATGLWMPVMNFVLNFSLAAPGNGGLSDTVWLTAITFAVFVPACGAYAFLLSQIALIFPSIAIDKPASWKMIWRLSEGRRTRNFLTLFIVVLTTAAAFAFATAVVSMLPDTSETVEIVYGGVSTTTQGSAPGVIETALTMVFGVAIMIVMVAAMAVALSRMYQSGAGRVPPRGSAAGQADRQPIQASDAK